MTQKGMILNKDKAPVFIPRCTPAHPPRQHQKQKTKWPELADPYTQTTTQNERIESIHTFSGSILVLSTFFTPFPPPHPQNISAVVRT